jgi:hypothetical protein
MAIFVLGGSNIALGITNDDCVDAEQIGEVTDKSFETRDATFDGPGDCMRSPNIWYCYTASCTGNATVSLVGSGYDTKLAVYDGCGCQPSSGQIIGCNDDFGDSYQSQISFPVVAGNKYLIEVGGYASDVGSGILNVSCVSDPSQEPPRNNCANAEAIGDVKNLPFTTTGTTFDGPGLCMTSPNIWFCYTATCTGDVTVSLLDSAYDTMLAVYDGCECNLIEQDMIACNDDFENAFQSQVTFPAIKGNRYLIEIGGYGSETGDGVLNVSCQGTTTGAKSDLGDAPDWTNNFEGEVMRAYSQPWVGAHFPTVFDDGSGAEPVGPLHVNDPLVAYLGKTITAETEADTGPDEDGVNNIHPVDGSSNQDGGDDGVAVPLVLANCGWNIFNYEVSVNQAGTDLWVNVWFDFNRDGDWDDLVECPDGLQVPEWAVQNQFLFDLPEGLNEISTPGFLSVHPDGVHDEIWMRITLSEQPWTGGSHPGEWGNAGSGPADKYQIGETEDYLFVPEVPAATDCPLCEDLNNDGVVDLDDLSDLIAKWLTTCL